MSGRDKQQRVDGGDYVTLRDLVSGDRIGDFVVDTPIGHGGMGVVYRAHQAGVDRPVALKVLAPDLYASPDFARRFRREAATMRDLEHPAILPVYAAGTVDGVMYLAMRLVSGASLAQLMAGGRMDRPRAMAVLRAVADALDYAHSRGVLHRDVKPANILVDDGGRPYLADFGIARTVSGGHTQTGQYVGTPRYMAPEQGMGGGGSGPRADVYSLACVAFEILTGSPPFIDVDTVPLLIAHASRPVPRATAVDPRLPGAVNAVLAKGLAKLPADRFPSARALVDALAQALSAPPLRRRGRLLVGAAVTAVTAVVGVTALVVLLAPAPDPPLPTTPSLAVAAARLADVPRGDLLYAAALDGTAKGFVQSPATEADSAKEAIRFVPGALEIESYAAGADTYSELDLDQGMQTYIGELDLATRPGTDVDLCLSLRWAKPRELANYLCVHTAQATAELSVFRRGQGRIPIGPQVALPGLTAGGTVRLAVVVRSRTLALYVGGTLAADVPNPDVPVARTLPGVEMEKAKGPGLVRIQALRFYALGTNT